MWMSRVDPPEPRQKLPETRLEATRKVERRAVRLFDLHAVETKHEIGIETQIWIDSRGRRKLELLQVEARDLGIVLTGLKVRVVRKPRRGKVGDQRQIRIQ